MCRRDIVSDAAARRRRRTHSSSYAHARAERENNPFGKSHYFCQKIWLMHACTQLLCTVCAYASLMTSTNVANCIHYHFWCLTSWFLFARRASSLFYPRPYLLFFLSFFFFFLYGHACKQESASCAFHYLCMHFFLLVTHHMGNVCGACHASGFFFIVAWLMTGWQPIEIFCCVFNLCDKTAMMEKNMNAKRIIVRVLTAADSNKMEINVK